MRIEVKEEMNFNENVDIKREITDEEIEIILAYITENFDKIDNYKNQFENCKKLSSYLSKNKLKIGDIGAEILLDKSSELNNMFEKLYKSNMLSKIYGFQNITVLLENYCQKTNIPLETNFDIKVNTKESNKDLDLFGLYLREIGQYRVLNREEEKELAIKAKKGDQNARTKLIEHNLRLVIPVAKRLVTQEVSLVDLVLAGNEGLTIAVDKFDPMLGYRFSTYAIWWIRQAQQKLISDVGKGMKISASLKENLIKLKKEIANYVIENGEYPSDDYLSEKFGLPMEKVLEIKKLMEPIISLSAPIKRSENGDVIGDMIVDEKSLLEERIHQGEIEEYVKLLFEAPKLSEKEKEILKLRYGFYGQEHTLEEIGKIYNLSRERIRQIENLALKKLIKYSRLCEKRQTKSLKLR